MKGAVLRGLSLALGLLIGWLAGGCATSGDPYFRDVQSRANVYVAPVPSAVHKVAVLPFKAPTELIGTSISDLFVTEMLRAGRYELVERSQMSKVLSESELALAGLSAAKAAAVGQMLGADGVVIGTVDEYVTVAQSGHPYPSVGITVRMIDCASGRVMWSADLALVADNKKVTLPMESRLVAHELTAGLYQKWKVQRKVARSALPQTSAEEAPDRPVGRNVPLAPVSAGAETGAPPAPPEFKASDLGLREVRLSWAPPADISLQYRIERARTGEGPFEALATLAATKKEYRDSGLQDNTAYYYRLVPLSAVGLAGLPSKVRESMTAPTPEPPAAVRAEAPASRAVCVTWTASPSEGVVRYVVERAPADSDQFVKVGAVEKTMFREGGEAGTDLRDSTKYLYRLTAINRVGAVGTPSQPVEVVTRPPPAPVTGLSAASGEVRCVSVAWTPSPETDVVRYDVYRCDATNAAFTLVKSIKGRTTTSFLDGGRDPGNLADQSAYEYKVRAINAVGAESADHEPVKAVTRGAPPVVAGLVAKSGQPRQVSLAWELSPDQKVVGYEIQRAAQGEAAPARIAEVSGREKDNFIDRGGSRWFSGGLGTLPDGTEYRYQVIAFNTARVCSPPTAPVSARTKPVPVAPSGLSTTTNLPKSVKITFRANPEKDIVCYVVEAAADAAGKFRELVRVDPTAEDALACTEAKLSDGAPRCYRIKAVDRDTLESPWSEVVAGATKPLPPPPADVRAEWKDDAAVLTWTASAAQDVKAYKVWKKSFFSAEVVATVAGPECRLTRAQVEKKINVFISAVDADGLESEHSAVLAVAPPPPPK